MNPNPAFHPPFALFAPFFLIFLAIGILVAIIPYWFIFKKAGFSPFLCLLMFVPLANLIVLYYVAFAAWTVTPENTGFRIPPPPGQVY